MNTHPPKALAILGPTASGKTGLALALAQRLPVEIISLDSALVYRGMDIGTAKPTAAELAAVPHHLINIISPLAAYSAADFVADCVQLVQAIHHRGHLPLIVGGTMMYYHALTHGLNSLPPANADIRAKLATEKQEYGLAYLYEQLQQVDPMTAERLAPSDSQRIERALEVWRLTGRSLSQHFAEQQASQAAITLHSAALIPENRSQLHTNIATRFEHMLAHGFVEEVQTLRQQYPTLTPNMPSMRCVGYRQAWAYLDGSVNQTQLTELGIVATRQLAKRQLTWLRKLATDTIWDPFQSTPKLLQAATDTAQRFFDY